MWPGCDFKAGANVARGGALGRKPRPTPSSPSSLDGQRGPKADGRVGAEEAGRIPPGLLAGWAGLAGPGKRNQELLGSRTRGTGQGMEPRPSSLVRVHPHGPRRRAEASHCGDCSGRERQRGQKAGIRHSPVPWRGCTRVQQHAKGAGLGHTNEVSRDASFHRAKARWVYSKKRRLHTHSPTSPRVRYLCG